MTLKPETQIVNNIQNWVNANNGNVLKLHGSAMQRLGEPDLIGGIMLIHDGRPFAVHFAVEVKLPGEEPRRLQEYRLSEWEKVGYCTGAVTSLDEFTKLLHDWVRLEAAQLTVWKMYG